MKLIAALIAFTFLTACGADAPPSAPAEPGVTVSGDARFGVVFTE